MAPQRTPIGDKVPKAKKAPTVKMSMDKVVKWPARGYHKFRNGLLNVTPKGGEKEIQPAVTSSPPAPKIRNAIWKLALGGKVYRPSLPDADHNKLMAPANDSTGTALLRVCRQIYAEAAEMALLHSTFSCNHPRQIKKCLNTLNKRQHAQIACLCIEIAGAGFLWTTRGRSFITNYVLSIPKYLSGLKEVVVRIFLKLPPDYAHAQDVEDAVRTRLEDITRGMQVKTRVDQTTLSWPAYDDAFRGIVRKKG